MWCAIISGILSSENQIAVAIFFLFCHDFFNCVVLVSLKRRVNEWFFFFCYFAFHNLSLFKIVISLSTVIRECNLYVPYFNNKIVFNLVFSVVGKCPVYNYAFGSTTATGRTCIHFKKGCPDPKYSPYHSSSFYKCMCTSQFDRIDWYYFL